MSYRLAYMRALLPAILLVTFSYLGWWGIVASATNIPSARAAEVVVPHAVSLSDARRAPDYMRYVHTGGTVAPNVRRVCDAPRFSDVSAYRWNGRALSVQRIDASRWYYWQHRRSGGRVYWSGMEFVNDAPVSVLVAGWCG